MTLAQLLILIAVFTSFMWGAWGWTVFEINPDSTNWLGFLFFYSTFFLALCGTVSLISFFVRRIRLKQVPDFHLVGVSFRQSLWISILLSAMLFLQGKSWLRWWNVLLILVVIIVTESFYLAQKSKSGSRKMPSKHAPINDAEDHIKSRPLFKKRDLLEVE